MDESTLYERIGGDVGVRAVVRTLHDRVEGDPDIAALLDHTSLAGLVDADVRWLACVLDGSVAQMRRERPVLIHQAPWWWGDRQRHLRDALWLTGLPTALVDEVAEAVKQAA